MLRNLPQTQLIIPCYNEETRLQSQAFLDFLAEHPDIGLVFVNDGSSDNTVGVLNKLAKQAPEQAHVLDLHPNKGKAEAVRHGVLHALENLNPERLAFWDADLATPLEQAPVFLDIMRANKSVRAVTGCRLSRLGAKIDRHMLRHYTGRIFATAASAILGVPVYDTQCGAKLFHADLAREIFAAPFLSPWFFDVELLARTIQLIGRKETRTAIHEHPLPVWVDVDGSRLKPTDFLAVPWELFRIWRAYRAELKD